MDFEWNEQKNKINILKHGIDFADMQEIFSAPILIKSDNRHDYHEKRWIGLGSLKDIIVVFVFTKRDKNLRVISIRKANKKERKIYNEAIESD
jgi:uncharacterized protein